MRVRDATVTLRSQSGDIIGPDQRVDVMIALKAMTIWPVWLDLEDDSKGLTGVRKLAADGSAIDQELLYTTRWAKTTKEGTKIYAATSDELKKADLLYPGRSEDNLPEPGLAYPQLRRLVQCPEIHAQGLS